jgi:hypothetical protein
LQAIRDTVEDARCGARIDAQIPTVASYPILVRNSRTTVVHASPRPSGGITSTGLPSPFGALATKLSKSIFGAGLVRATASAIERRMLGRRGAKSEVLIATV